MKKIFAVAASLILVVVTANSQSEKKEVPPPPPPKRIDEKVKFKPPVIDENLKEFYKRNLSVTFFSMKANKVTLKLKDDKKEEYNLNNQANNKNFTEKYGKAPVPPPPPPKVKSKA